MDLALVNILEDFQIYNLLKSRYQQRMFETSRTNALKSNNLHFKIFKFQLWSISSIKPIMFLST